MKNNRFKKITFTKIRQRSSVFTILELLFVIIIMMVILTFLMPSFARVKTTSYRASCTSNLRGISMALNMYAQDYGLFPLDDPLVRSLNAGGALGKMANLKCPLDISNQADTYSYGYLGGHPIATSDNDPLVVCGWHGRVGVLANFNDASVDELIKREGRKSLPVTATFGNHAVQPGFTLHPGTPVVLTAANGYQASLLGNGGASLVAATYDPFANNGSGRFDIAVNFAQAISNVNGASSDASMTIRAKFKYSTLRITSAPPPVSSFIYLTPGIGLEFVTMSNLNGFFLVNRYTGASVVNEIPVPATQYQISSSDVIKIF